MEKHQHNEAFREEYWEDALAVLKREERKAFRRKVLTWTPAVAVVMAAIIMYFLPSGNALGQLANNEDRDPLTVHQSGVMHLSEISEGVHNQDAEAVEVVMDEPTLVASDDETNASAEMIASAESILQSPDRISSNSGEATDYNTEEIVPEVELPSTDSPSAFNTIIDESESRSILFRSDASQDSDHSFNIRPLESRMYKHRSSAGSLRLTSWEDKHREFLRLPSQRNQFMAYLGNAFATGYGTVKGASALNPLFGVAFETRVANRLWFRAGLGAQLLSNVRVSKEYLEVTPGFGYEYASTEISTVQLALAEAPFSLIWDANLRHSFFAGVGLEYVAITKNRLTTTEVTVFTESVTEESEDYGYLTGYSPVMWNLHGGYRYRLTRRSSIDLAFSTGLSPVVEGQDARNQRLILRLNWGLK